MGISGGAVTVQKRAPRIKNVYDPASRPKYGTARIERKGLKRESKEQQLRQRLAALGDGGVSFSPLWSQ